MPTEAVEPVAAEGPVPQAETPPMLEDDENERLREQMKLLGYL